MDDNGSICKVTIDGTDCRILEPAPFDRKWYSHKFHGPGVRYEVGLCIQNGWIVWVNGPYPCGSHSDLKIAKDWIFRLLGGSEMVLADGGYNDGGLYAETPTGLHNQDQKMKKDARSRHETVNRRLKHFNILTHTYRHDVAEHGIAFRAVAVLTQIAIQTDEPLFQVDYYDN